ncbi:hypothetical protein KUTeg_014364 [Tegillarca granosa]|uniref:Uncharacterized protein n=1 Tax=Tegillarca granosa TaxID=220873 RepID=A0ABQ9F041_TEGGR|nr:hypothetical protein KUTeg_014364 [Tegillarca granosa]
MFTAVQSCLKLCLKFKFNIGSIFEFFGNLSLKDTNTIIEMNLFICSNFHGIDIEKHLEFDKTKPKFYFHNNMYLHTFNENILNFPQTKFWFSFYYFFFFFHDLKKKKTMWNLFNKHTKQNMLNQLNKLGEYNCLTVRKGHLKKMIDYEFKLIFIGKCVQIRRMKNEIILKKKFEFLPTK